MPDLTPVIEAVRGTRRCLIASHVDPEGDALGSQLALAAVLRDLGAEVAIVNEDTPPDKYAFMPGVESIVTPAGAGNQLFDTAFILDCGSLDRIGTVAEHLGSSRIVNIDHHGSNTNFGELNYVVPDACATGYLIYWLNAALGLPLDLPRAVNMYVAIITDTGNFQFSNTDADVLRVAATLIDTGIDPAHLSRCVFGYKPLRALKLLGAALESLHTVLDGRVGIIVLDQAAFERAGACDQDAEGVVNFAKRVEGTDAGVLLRETPSGEVKISLRSDGQVDVDAIAKRFGGGGHRNAAGARHPGPLDLAVRSVLSGFDGAIRQHTA